MSAYLAGEHATDDELELVAMDRLDPNRAGPLAIHLERCEFCRQRLAAEIRDIAALREGLRNPRQAET